MESNFVTYQQALALKELGFDEECLAFYNGKFLQSTNYDFDDDTSKDIGLCIKAPLRGQVFKFFIDSFNLKQFVGWRPNVKKFDSHIVDMTLNGIEYAKSRGFKEFNSDLLFDDYDKAESHLIDLMIERAKQENNGK
jgi:hypothetical protein